MKKYLVFSALVLMLLNFTALAAGTVRSGLPRLEFADTRLDNGLRVILAPTIAHRWWG